MKKKLLILLCGILCAFSGKVSAQLDLEHWIPPFLQSSRGLITVSSVRLLLSTDKVQPFKVRLYNNNQLVKEFTLSKDQPIEYEVPDDSKIRATSIRNTMRPVKMGYHLAGEKSFFVSLRMYGIPISGMIASKGKTALGTEFYVVNDQSILYDENEPNGRRKFMMNYQASIMALEDNTHIKVANYDDRLVFTDGTDADELNFVLNKGESYIVAAVKSDNPTPNNPIPVLDDNDPNLIGAKITSDKKIIVNNGNFLSQDLGDIGENINLDQSLPTSKIGKEYFIANGLTIPDGFMEKMVMVATQDDTKIYLNDETAPFKTLNEGEYFIGPAPKVKKFKVGSQPSWMNSNMKLIETKGIYLRSSKPMYIFQMVGGFQHMPTRMEPDLTPSTSAMMFSFPIDKNYLPDPRQNLSNTVVIPNIGMLSDRPIDTKITIKTEDGATVKVNNQTIPPSDFSPIVGKPGWSYWSRFQLGGDLSVTSDKSVNVDYTGGYMFSGIAGSFTGFSNDPFIIKNGNCIQETVILSLNNSDFEHIQWQLNGVNIAGANSPTYIPTLPGSYRCVLSYMDFTFITDPVQVENCPYAISTRNIGDQCPDFTVTPFFSPPNGNLPIVSTEILTQPAHGTVTLEGNVFRVIPQEGFTGSDRFIYKITGSTGFYEVVKIEYNVLATPIGDIKESILPEVSIEPNYFYNLNLAINTQNNETFVFYENEEDATNETNPIVDVLNYSTTTEKTIYVRVTAANGCFVVKNFQLLIPPKPGNVFSLPNVLTPNNDGLNDVWDYSALKNTELIEMKIFDRFGALVYQHQSAEKYFWSGKDLSGKSMKTAAYWAVFTYRNTDGKMVTESMWILLKNS